MSSIKPCPKPFSFSNPREGGIVVKENVVECSSNDQRDYHKLVQLLKWSDTGFSIRFGYYQKPKGAKENEWRWGSQTTLVIDIEAYRSLLDALADLIETYERLQKK